MYQAHNATDPWVEEALKLFDSHLYEDTQGWTKSGATVYEVQEIVREQAAQDRSWRPDFRNDEQVDWDRTKYLAMLRFSVDGFKVQPYTLEQALDGMVLDTSAGYGYPGKKKYEVLDQLKSQAEGILHTVRMGHKVDPLPCTVGTRGVLRPLSSKKRRAIYIVPGAHVWIERMFATPLTEKMKSYPDKSPMFFGKRLLPRLRRLLEKSYGRGSYAVSGDFSHLDRDVLEWLIDEAFGIVRELIDFEHWDGKRVSPAQQKRYERWFDYVVEYFIHTLVMLPDGTFEWLDGGVPSGSAFTQLIDSIVTYLMIDFVAKRTGHGVYVIHVLGDDSKTELAGRPDLELWAKLLLKWFGMTLSVEKTRIYGTRFRQKKFLGYDIRSGYLERERMELFRLLLYVEKEVDSIEKSYTRLIAYMFLGGVNDLRFSKFFEYYQSCYDIPDVSPTLSYDLDTKRKYAGFDMPMKTLRSYNVNDFRRGLFNYEL